MADVVPKIAFIGVGRMGLPMLRSLICRHGFPASNISCYDISPRVSALPEVQWCKSAAEAICDSDIVLTCLPLPAHVRETVLNALDAFKPGATWVDLSTTDYHNTCNLQQQLAARQVRSLEAPICNMSHMGVDVANASMYVGGDAIGYAAVKELLGGMVCIAFHVSDTLGPAQSLKLLVNAMFYTHSILAAEAFGWVVTHQPKIDKLAVWDFLCHSAASTFFLEQYMPMVWDGCYDNSYSFEIAVKDLWLAHAMAQEKGIDVPMVSVAAQYHSRALERYGGDANGLSVVRYYEEEHGLKLPIEGYRAPSPYGSDPTYHHGELVRHSGGDVEGAPDRMRPVWPSRCLGDRSRLSAKQVACLGGVVKWMEAMNWGIFSEAMAIGRAMGVSSRLISRSIFWSVGSCHVADHAEAKHDHESVARMVALSRPQAANLPTMFALHPSRASRL